jgi:hypothetical protein
LATEYISFPIFFLNAAKIFHRNGKTAEAKAFIQKSLDSDILVDDIKAKLENELEKY